MFVKIDNQDMDALKVEEWINRTRDANGGVISPEFAMEILGKTNHFAHIKKVINLIKKNCSDNNGELVADKVAPYKDFILSCVDRREMSPQAMAVLQELAETGGFKDEFDKTNDKVKIYELKDCENVDVKIIKSKEELEALGGENLRVFFDADEVDLRYYNLKGLKIKFKEGAEVKLYKAKHLTKELDLSMCSVVDLGGCDLNGVEKIKFGEGAEVNLIGAKNLPKDLDVSMCSKVDLSYCDLDGLKLKFREGAEVILHSAMNLPKDLDVSMCSKVNLGYCNICGLDLKFREGAEVKLYGTTGYQKELDFSMCSYVNLSGWNLTGVEKIKFKDKVQEAEAMGHALRSSEKVEYVGDKKGISVVNGNSDMEM